MNFEGYFSRLTDMLERIGDLLPQCRVYEALFPQHKPLQVGIVQLYTSVVEFVCHAESTFKSPHGLLGRSVWKKFDEMFHRDLAQLQKHRDTVETQAGIAHQLEQQKAAQEIAEMSRMLSLTHVELSRIRAELCELKTIRSREQGKPT